MLCQEVDIVREAACRRQGEVLTGAGMGGARVLVVEDDCLIAMVVEDALAALGFQNVHLAHELTHGWALVDQVNPTFAILDVNVGRELVFPLAIELQRRHIPFVFSTGNARNAMPVEWRNHIIVPKPLQRTTLAHALRSIGMLPILECPQLSGRQQPM